MTPVREPAATERRTLNVRTCGACGQQPYPTHALLDVAGVGPVAVCQDPRFCRERGLVLGIWCTT